MRLRSVVMALLLVPLLAVSAGAIYLEGQAPPVDDGQYHILAAESGMGLDTSTSNIDVPVAVPYDTGPIKRYLSDDPNDYVLVPGNEPGMVYALGDMGTAPDAVTSYVPTVTLPSITSYTIPYDTIGSEIGGLISSPAFTFSLPDMAFDDWYGSSLNNFNVNMPMLSFPVL